VWVAADLKNFTVSIFLYSVFFYTFVFHSRLETGYPERCQFLYETFFHSTQPERVRIEYMNINKLENIAYALRTNTGTFALLLLLYSLESNKNVCLLQKVKREAPKFVLSQSL
jgi:hypothetical protein